MTPAATGAVRSVQRTRARSGRWTLGPAALLVAAGAAAPASAQWTVISLHPSGARTSRAMSIENGQQAGYAEYDAVLWTGTADSMVVLDPTPEQGARALCIDNGAQYGDAAVFDALENRWNTHAAVWTGTAASFVDLHPPEIGAVHSRGTSAHNGAVGGSFFVPDGGGATFALDRPCWWTSTSPASFVDLTPLGISTGEVRGIFGNQQVGAHFDNFLATACMWNGTPDSYVELNPPGALFSAAGCTDGVHQYGVAIFFDGVSGGTQVGYWSGTADSWVDMTPPGTFGFSINAVDGSQQVGATAPDPVGNPPIYAAIWNGTAASYVNLHDFVPARYNQSEAMDIWHDPQGYAFIVGYGVNAETNEPEAVMWLPARPGTDLVTSVTAPRICTIPAGRELDFNVNVANGGLDISGPVTVTVTLPDASLATFASAAPAPTTVTPTTLTFDLPAIGGGDSSDITVTLNALAGEEVVQVTAAASTTSDYDLTNNDGSDFTRTLLALAAGEHVEIGDAPEVGGQVIETGPVTAIEGRVQADADVYKIRVDDWANFAVQMAVSELMEPCNGGTSTIFTADAELFLFDENGVGIVFNDDAFGLVPDLFAGDPIYANRTNGETVYLAISQYNYLPTSGGNLIWEPEPAFLTRTPDGPGAAGAFDGWIDTDDGTTGAFFYRLLITGASGVFTCDADLDGSGDVDVFDLLAYLDLWFVSDPAADLDGNFSVDVFDLLAYLDGWFAGC